MPPHCYIALLLLVSLSLVTTQDVRQPPSITEDAGQYKYYEAMDPVQLPCVATGEPKPEYSWTYNGGEVPAEVVQSTTDGNLTISMADSAHKGYWQCQAKNKYGTAISNSTSLRLAVFRYPSVENQKRTVEQGNPFSINCADVTSVPDAIYSWKKGAVDDSSVIDNINQSPRITWDEQGTLYFAHVLEQDGSSDYYYKCYAQNTYLRDIGQSGTFTMLTVTSTSLANTAPTRLAPSTDKTTVVGILGESVRMKGFFSGYPTPSISWSLSDVPPTPDRENTENYDTELVIRDLRWSDEGTYTCTGSNTAGKYSVEYNLKVESPPFFESSGNKPYDKNATVGDDVTFHCKTTGVPDVNVQWLINAVAVDPTNPGYRRQVSSDGTSLTISSVCKNCGEQVTTDLAVIQCNASNVHGYQFAAGYLNVLEKTTILEGPADVSLNEGDTVAEFRCDASTDPSTPLVVRWKYGDTYIYPDAQPRYTIDSKHTLRVNITKASVEEQKKLVGTYTCQADNMYSEHSISAELSIAGIVPDPEAVSGASIGDLWWVFVIIAAIILLMIMAILIVMYIKRNDGQDYLVDEKERRNGNDPVKELADLGFSDYSRPTDGGTRKRPSLASTIRLSSEDSGSLNEYATEHRRNIDENGSFVDPYMQHGGNMDSMA